MTNTTLSILADLATPLPAERPFESLTTLLQILFAGPLVLSAFMLIDAIRRPQPRIAVEDEDERMAA